MGILERQLRQEGILDAAAKVFFSLGFGNTKMLDIAKKARLSKGLVYFYYKSKEDLYMAVVYNACKLNIEFYEKTLAKKKDGTALDKLLFLVRSYFSFGKEYPFFQEAISTYLSIMNPSKKIASGVDISDKLRESPHFEKINNLQMQPLNILLNLFEEGKKDGSIKTNLDPVFLYMTIWSLMIGYEKLSSDYHEKNVTNMHSSFYNLDNQKWRDTITDLVKIALTTPKADI